MTVCFQATIKRGKDEDIEGAPVPQIAGRIPEEVRPGASYAEMDPV